MHPWIRMWLIVIKINILTWNCWSGMSEYVFQNMMHKVIIAPKWCCWNMSPPWVRSQMSGKSGFPLHIFIFKCCPLAVKLGYMFQLYRSYEDQYHTSQTISCQTVEVVCDLRFIVSALLNTVLAKTLEPGVSLLWMYRQNWHVKSFFPFF